jgi:anti-sigma factor RsiW
MNSQTNKPPEHPDALLLPYVEETLSPEDLTPLLQHLKECGRCSAEVEALRRTTAVLKENKHALCPEAAELFQAAEQGGRVEASLSSHLERCPRCREELASYAATATPEIMPQELWSKIKERLDQPTRQPRVAEKPPWDFRELFARLFRLPALGVAVAAAVLLVVVMAPWEGAQLPMWEHAPRPKAGTEIGRQRAAVVILFKNLEKPLSSKRIHELYQALEPRIDVVEKYDLVAPAAMSAVIGKGELNAKDRQAILESLRNKLNVSLGVLVTVTREEQGFRIHGELVNAADGTVLAQDTVQAPRDAELAPIMSDLVRELLLRKAPEKG